MVNQLKEYTGTGASGGNSTDGNEIPSPRPFIDDEAEMNNYLEKIYMVEKLIIIEKNQLYQTQIERDLLNLKKK